MILFLVAIMIGLSTHALGVLLCVVLFSDDRFDNIIGVDRGCTQCIRGAWNVDFDFVSVYSLVFLMARLLISSWCMCTASH